MSLAIQDDHALWCPERALSTPTHPHTHTGPTPSSLYWQRVDRRGLGQLLHLCLPFSRDTLPLPPTTAYTPNYPSHTQGGCPDQGPADGPMPCP